MLGLNKNRSKIAIVMIVSVLGIAAAVTFGPSIVHADDTNNNPWVRPDNWMAEIIKSPSGGVGSGHIGLDIALSNGYNPCHNTSDSDIAGCQTSGGYYKVLHYTSNGNDFPYGIFTDNSNNGVNHYWARRMKTAYLEVYPYSVNVASNLSGYRLDSGACGCTVYGGLEVIVNDWKGGYSADIGTLRSPSMSDGDAAKMNGFIRRNGVTVGNGIVNIDWFGQDSNTSHSSAGYPSFSFASWPTNADGYYTSGPVVKGNYHLFVTDNGPAGHGPVRKIECVGIPVTGKGDRMDLELTQQHFGLDGPNRQCFDR
jgi:hypothetical protein